MALIFFSQDRIICKDGHDTFRQTIRTVGMLHLFS